MACDNGGGTSLDVPGAFRGWLKGSVEWEASRSPFHIGVEGIWVAAGFGAVGQGVVDGDMGYVWLTTNAWKWPELSL